MESLIFAANGMYVASYFMHDILRLRLLTVVAAGCLATYFYVLPQPMWTVIGWNTFFIALNLFQIARELRARSLAKRHEARARLRTGREHSRLRSERPPGLGKSRRFGHERSRSPRGPATICSRHSLPRIRFPALRDGLRKNHAGMQ